MVVSAMESRGWSAHALSKASGVDRRVIDRLLSRTRCPMVDTLARIADALGMALPVGGATAIAVARGGSASRGPVRGVAKARLRGGIDEGRVALRVG